MVIAAVLLGLMAITQPGGAGTTIFLYDDTNNTNHAAAPGPHTFAEIATAFPADFVDNGTNRKSYRAKVTVQVGDTGVGTATTTLTDTNVAVDFDNTKTLAYRATQTTSWFTNLGTKVGSGNQASGKDGCTLSFGAATNIRGTTNLYGCTMNQVANSAWNFVPASDGVGELVDCIFNHRSTAANFSIGATGLAFSNVYNVDVTIANGSAIAQLNSQTAERVTLSGPAPAQFINTSGVVNIKDFLFIGSPTSGDIRSTTATTPWTMVKPVWSQSGNPKFSVISVALNLAHKEYWPFRPKVVDRTGAGVSGIPLTLTDLQGNVQVSGTTNSDGEIMFGSGITTNAVIVVDHYQVGGVYTIQHRSPFTIKVNTSDLVGFNPNYLPRIYKFNWLGYRTYTTTAGQLDDMADIIPIEDQSGGPTAWVETSVP